MCNAGSGLTGHYAHVTAASRRGRWVLGGCALIALVVVGAVAWNAHFGTWATLHQAADDFEPPDGFVELDRWDQGTDLCWISCDEARVVVLYRVDLDVEAACEALPTATESLGRDLPERRFPLGLCSGVNDLAGLDGRGTVGWSIDQAEALTEDPFYPYDAIRAKAGRMDGLAAVVIFNSGLD